RRWYGADTAKGRLKRGRAAPFHRAGHGGRGGEMRSSLAFFSGALFGGRRYGLRGQEGGEICQIGSLPDPLPAFFGLWHKDC
ncbi:MAG: hypothetical protein AL399_08125, partial [Candidatus [Bacteroides] periocalifornicus]